jgi:glucokinase
VYLTISTGVGGGVILDGAIFEGASGLAGELGHVIVRDGGPSCNFGHSGCLEALASGTAIARDAALLVPPLCPPDRAPDGESVATAAAAGHAGALRILQAAGRALGLALGGIVNTFDPSRIVLGGGVTRSFALWEGSMRAALAEVVMTQERRRFTVVLAETGDDAGLLGAAANVWDQLAALEA